MTEVQRWIAPDFDLLDLPVVTDTDMPEADPEQITDLGDLPDMTALDDQPSLPTLEQIAEIERAAHAEGMERGLEEGRQQGLEEGRAAGHAEGLAAGQAEIRRLVAQIEGIVDNFSRPLARLEDEVLQALGDVAVRIAGALVGRAYQADPTLLASLVRQAVASIGTAQRPLQVRLHPDDLDTLVPLLDLPSDCNLVPDTTLSRGDLRVHAESVRIDGSLQARLAAALLAVQQGEDTL